MFPDRKQTSHLSFNL